MVVKTIFHAEKSLKYRNIFIFEEKKSQNESFESFFLGFIQYYSK